MGQDDVIYDKTKIEEILLTACKNKTLVEVKLDTDAQVYCGQFLELATADEGNSGKLVMITPLEPPAGNMKIRRSQAVSLQFHVDNLEYQGKSGFSGAKLLESGQALALSLPRVVQSAARRKQERLQIPQEITIKVTVTKRGTRPLTGDLSDITPSGLSMCCPVSGELLEKTDRVNLEINTNLVRDTIQAMGTVCYVAQIRSPADLNQVQQKYGVELNVVSTVQSMQIDRLIKALQKKR